MIIGKTCVRKPTAWKEKPSCQHFGRYQYFAAWMDRSTHGERLIENIPLCAKCYETYVSVVNDKINSHYAKAEREAEKVVKLNEIIKRCGRMFQQVAA